MIDIPRLMEFSAPSGEVGSFGDLERYIDQGCIPGGTGRNFESVAGHLPDLTDFQRAILCDPQTSGGLLVSVRPEACTKVQSILKAAALPSASIGMLSTAASTIPKLMLRG